MKNDDKREPETLSEVAMSNEVTFLNKNGSVYKVGKWREWFAATEDHEGLYKRLAMFFREKRIRIK